MSKQIKKHIGLLSVLMLVIVSMTGMLAACNGEDSEGTTTPPTNPPQETPKYPLTITDQAGRDVIIKEEPSKIVSLSPGITEILFSLGLGDSVVGVTEYCDYPEAALEKVKVGGFSTVDVEKVTEIQPDLIIAGDMHVAEIVPKMESLGFDTFVIEPRSINQVLEAMEMIAEIADIEDEAESIIKNLKDRIDTVTEKTSALTAEQTPKVFYVLWHDPVMSVGQGTRINELITLAGGINIAETLGDGYPSPDNEFIIEQNPQIIIVGASHGSYGDVSLEFAQTAEIWETLDARVNDQVYGILADFVSRPSPRLVDGLELLAKIIHPEIFGAVGAWQ